MRTPIWQNQGTIIQHPHKCFGVFEQNHHTCHPRKQISQVFLPFVITKVNTSAIDIPHKADIRKSRGEVEKLCRSSGPPKGGSD
jgi:hypothetical protein